MLIAATSFLVKPAEVSLYQYAIITAKGFLSKPDVVGVEKWGSEVDTPAKCRTICITEGALAWNYYSSHKMEPECRCTKPGQTWEEIKAINLADTGAYLNYIKYDQTCTVQFGNESLDVVPSGNVNSCLASVEMPVSILF